MDPLIQKVLGDPSKYPRELTSWLAKTISGNRLFQIDWSQLPGPRISVSVSTSAPKSPQPNDLWYQTDTAIWKRYNGSAWV